MCVGAFSSARARAGEVEALLVEPDPQHGNSLADYLSATARAESLAAPMRIEALSALCMLAKSRTDTFLYVWLRSVLKLMLLLAHTRSLTHEHSGNRQRISPYYSVWSGARSSVSLSVRA